MTLDRLYCTETNTLIIGDPDNKMVTVINGAQGFDPIYQIRESFIFDSTIEMDDFMQGICDMQKSAVKPTFYENVEHPDPDKYNPDPEYLREIISKLGVTQHVAASKMGIAVRTMRAYLQNSESAGYRSCPYTVQYALETWMLLVSKDKLHRWQFKVS